MTASSMRSAKRSSPSGESPNPHESSSAPDGSSPHTNGPQRAHTSANRLANESAMSSYSHNYASYGVSTCPVQRRTEKDFVAGLTHTESGVSPWACVRSDQRDLSDHWGDWLAHQCPGPS